MKLVFSTRFRDDLLVAETHYFKISTALGERLHARVKDTLRSIVRWGGGDHIGPHGYPCKRCTPFPLLLYYEMTEGTIRVLALIHETRHPDDLHKQSGAKNL